MEFVSQTVAGPSTKISADEARKKLVSHPNFPKGATNIVLTDKDGRWSATFDVPKVAAPFDGAPNDEGTSEPPSGPPSEDGPPADLEEELSDEPKEDEEGGKDGLEKSVAELTDLVHQIADTLGVGKGPEDSPVPGDEGPPPGPPKGAKPTPAPRPLKPGEVKGGPGSVPVGSPAFSSVQVPDDHPFKEHIGRVASFEVDGDDQEISKASADLKAQVEPFGYKVKQLRRVPNGDGGHKLHALVSVR